MLPEMHHLAVNWQDGMKIRTSHLVALDNFIRDTIRDAIGTHIDGFHYGLLPAAPDAPSPLKLKCDVISGNKIKVVLLACRAVTAGGIRIERREEENTVSGLKWIECIYPMEEDSPPKLDILISAELFSKVAVGDPDPEETPPRRPWVVPRYHLKILPAGSPLHSMNELKLGEIAVENKNAKISETYIPPCSKINCFPALLDLYRIFGTDFNSIAEHSINILQKFRSGKAPKVEDIGIIHDNLSYLIENIALFLANHLDSYHKIIPESPPVFWVEYLVRFTRVVRTVFRCMDASKQRLLNSFRLWGPGFEPGNFETNMDEIIEMDYDHLNIRAIIDKIQRFVKPLSRLMESLAKSNYVEFYRGAGIVIVDVKDEKTT